MKIGIIGYGYVGKAVAAAYDSENTLINDPLYPDISVSVQDMKNNAEAIFICVPTPQSSDGSCDTSILEEVLNNLTGYKGIVICKSTATPLYYKLVLKRFAPFLKLVHAPEFLTAKNAIHDYLNPHKILIGCDTRLNPEYVTKIVLTDKINFKKENIEYCSFIEAAMFKYVANCYLAMKVIINNEFFNVCNKLNLKWDNISSIAITDSRLGDSHWQVPGPDGEYGFGGACFPKDTTALLHMAKNLNIDMTMLETAVNTNTTLRKNI